MDKFVVEYVNKLLSTIDIGDYIGVIAYGSYIGGRSNILSDIDVMIIKSGYNTSDCGSNIIDGIRVEYFIQDINRLYSLVDVEISKNDPSHLTKFATCEILYDKDDIVKNFISYAVNSYNKRINSEFNDNDKFSIFSINNRLEDLESLIEFESFYAVYYVTLEKIRCLYTKINGYIDLPLTKIQRLYTDTEFAKKYIQSDSHSVPDATFIELYLECINLDDKVTMLNKLKKLYDYSFGHMLFDPNNFVLKFEGKAPFRL